LIVVGMMHHRKRPAEVNRAYACAAVAKAEGVSFFYFSPQGVDTENERIRGFVYDDGRWKSQEFSYPDVIYNTGSPARMRKYQRRISRLRKKVPFTTSALGNKKRVFERLQKGKVFRDYLPETLFIRDSAEAESMLEKYGRIVVKPVNGHQGIGIVYVEKNPYGIRVVEEEYNQLLTTEEFAELIKSKIAEEPFLAQPYIRGITKDGKSCDFRLHVQKNQQGIWVFTAGYVRVAQGGSIVCNISRGGYTNYLEPFLEYEYGERGREFIPKLEEFALGLANHLDNIHEKTFNESLDELGIDIGIDENERIWLYEVNWRPGSPPTFYLELDVVKNALLYAVYLAKKHIKSRELV